MAWTCTVVLQLQTSVAGMIPRRLPLPLMLCARDRLSVQLQFLCTAVVPVLHDGCANHSARCRCPGCWVQPLLAAMPPSQRCWLACVHCTIWWLPAQPSSEMHHMFPQTLLQLLQWAHTDYVGLSTTAEAAKLLPAAYTIS